MRVLSIGDTHAPFMHPDAIPFLAAVANEYPPDIVVHQGDVADQHALSRYTHDPDGHSTRDEMDKAAEQLGPLYELFPKAKVCRGNHDRRLQDRAAEAGIPKKYLKEVNEILGGPVGWKWQDQWEVGEIIYEHGDPFSGKQAHIQIAQANMQSTVIGHIHGHAGISYLSNRKHLVFGFNVGCLIDRRTYAFQYAKKAQARPIIGVGIINNGVPTFVPMPLKAGGRWTGGL